jgi:ribosomal protein L13
MKTFLAENESPARPKWYLIDAEGAVLGRLAGEGRRSDPRSEIRPPTPFSVGAGDYVVISSMPARWR